MIIYVFDRVENIVGKGEIACISMFFLFPRCFQKASFLDPSKGVIVWEWDNMCYLKRKQVTVVKMTPVNNTVNYSNKCLLVILDLHS